MSGYVISVVIVYCLVTVFTLLCCLTCTLYRNEQLSMQQTSTMVCSTQHLLLVCHRLSYMQPKLLKTYHEPQLYYACIME